MLLVAKNIISDSNLFFYLYNFSQSTTFEYNSKETDVESSLLEYDKNVLVFLNEYLYAKEKFINFNFLESVNVEHIMPASGHNIDIIREDAGIENKEEFDSVVNMLESGGNRHLESGRINQF